MIDENTNCFLLNKKNAHKVCSWEFSWINVIEIK